MFDLTQILSQPSGAFAVAGTALGLIALGSAAFAAAKVSSIRKRMSDLLRAPSGADLESVLNEHLRERSEMKTEVAALTARVQELEQRMQTSKRHLGLVKYDAFDDVSGNQSFALALYDDAGNGTLITSIIGRMDCRVYAKPLLKLTSERSLSQEEERAIREARAGSPKSIVS